MIIGAIEQVWPDRVVGWIHSHAADLKGSVVLAFVEDRCVGSGRVGLFRKDLADAGLLHGELGFDFPIALASPEDAGRVVVTLERCEAVLLQRSSRVVPAGGARPAAAEAPAAPWGPPRETVAWLCEFGAVGSAEVDLVEALDDYGVALWQPEQDSGPAGRAALPRRAAARLFSLCALRPVEAAELPIGDMAALREAVARREEDRLLPAVIAFHADRPLRLRVLEGSHRLPPGAEAADPATHGLDYPVGPDSLLLLHRACRFGMEELPPNRRLRLLYPCTA